MDVNEADSIALHFLRLVCAQSAGGRGPKVQSVGWELGLSDNEMKDVVQHLEARGLIAWRSGSRGWRMADRLSLAVVPTEGGRGHVRAMLDEASGAGNALVTPNQVPPPDDEGKDVR